MATFKMAFPKREGDLVSETVVEVTNIDQAKMAESAGANCVLVSEPARQGISISRMLDPLLIREIKKSIKIPIMARARVGHFVEAQILQAARVDFIDESELLTSADHSHFINKHDIGIPVIRGCKDLGEALRITTPADVALMVNLWCFGVFIDSDVFNCPDPETKLRAMVQATDKYDAPSELEILTRGLSYAMEG